MQAFCTDNLLQIKKLIDRLPNEKYAEPCEKLFDSSIGKHVRHTLEFYKCLFDGLDSGTVNYDGRERDVVLETDTEKAMELITDLECQLKAINSNKGLKIIANYTDKSQADILMTSSFYRELGFCLEHSIHHLAMIKIGLKELNCLNLIDKNFGIAPATLRHQKQCAQ